MNLAPNEAASYTPHALGNYDHRHAIVGRAIITGPHDSGGNLADVGSPRAGPDGHSSV
jgi:hypothetical protein